MAQSKSNANVLNKICKLTSVFSKKKERTIGMTP